MNSGIFTFAVIPIIVLAVFISVQLLRQKIYKPEYESAVQKPGKWERAILFVIICINIISILGTIMGILIQETEMMLVFGVMTLFFSLIILVLRRAYNTSYQENKEYFVLHTHNKKYKVFYENITDWRPSYNEIAVLDASRSDGKYIRVNLKIFKPEILLRKMADMAFEEKFPTLDGNDPYKTAETIYYIANYGYKYLVEDYLEVLEDR